MQAQNKEVICRWDNNCWILWPLSTKRCWRICTSIRQYMWSRKYAGNDL